MSTSTPLAAVVISSLLFGACAKSGSAPEPQVAPSPMPTTTVVAEPAPLPPEPVAEPAPPPPVEEPKPEPLTDPQIAKILETVDTAEIEQAKIAQKKSKNADVKKFAAHMIQAHTKSKQKGGALARKAKLKPEESPVSTELSGKATAVLESLKTADATTIDALYIDAQATQHQEVLALVDARLLPSTTHEELKGLLGEARTMVESHHTEAKAIQEKLAAAPATGAGAAAPAAPAGKHAAPESAGASPGAQPTGVMPSTSGATHH